NVSHMTIYRWVQEYGKLLYQIWKKKNKKSFYSWKMDETYIKIKGKRNYLYQAIDADGLSLDICLRKKRDTQAAYAFLKRLVKQFDEPNAVVTHKAPFITSPVKKVKEYVIYQETEHCTSPLTPVTRHGACECSILSALITHSSVGKIQHKYP